MDFFLGGTGEGKLNSGGFATACLQVITKGGSSILGHPGQTSVSGFDNPSTCSHSDDSGGAAAFFPTRTPRYIEGSFLVSRTGCAREHHGPCIEDV